MFCRAAGKRGGATARSASANSWTLMGRAPVWRTCESVPIPFYDVDSRCLGKEWPVVVMAVVVGGYAYNPSDTSLLYLALSKSFTWQGGSAGSPFLAYQYVMKSQIQK